MLRNLKKSMTKSTRVAPYKQKGRRPKKKDEKNKQVSVIKIEGEKNREKIHTMTQEELTQIQLMAAQNALTLFNGMLEEFKIRIPRMSDETLAAAMINVWAKVNNEKR